ncbi:MAG: sulfite exporter TauE/SafE family protein, partial [Deltaproteobacteria bacterium]|nr:sulfite exporter TauE/SafE family protein [Deltaproteobacteria bacterium]
MTYLQRCGVLLMAATRAHAQWEIETARAILRSRKALLLLLLLLLPILLCGIAHADEIGAALPAVIGGKKAYAPAFYTTNIFLASILIGIVAGLITGCIGAGGGFIIAPALMSAGIKGILAVGTDL